MGTGKRRKRSKAERRQIVEETMKPGISVSRVALAHGINPNQIFQWRKLYREGQLEAEPSRLLPVTITEAHGKPSVQGRPRTVSGTIDIDLGHARVRIEGDADPACVRAAIDGLIR